jgi:hypothetical protein
VDEIFFPPHDVPIWTINNPLPFYFREDKKIKSFQVEG